MNLLIDYFDKEELGQLRPEWAGGLSGVGDVLDDGPKFAGQVLVQMID